MNVFREYKEEREIKKDRDERYLSAIRKMREYLKTNLIDVHGKSTNALIRKYAELNKLEIPEQVRLKEWLAVQFDIPVKTARIYYKSTAKKNTKKIYPPMKGAFRFKRNTEQSIRSKDIDQVIYYPNKTTE